MGTPAGNCVKFLLDEHYPGWLAEQLHEVDIDVVTITGDQPDLQDADDVTVLRVAAGEGRVVVTEDVRTVGIAVAASWIYPMEMPVSPYTPDRP